MHSSKGVEVLGALALNECVVAEYCELKTAAAGCRKDINIIEKHITGNRQAQTAA